MASIYTPLLLLDFQLLPLPLRLFFAFKKCTHLNLCVGGECFHCSTLICWVIPKEEASPPTVTELGRRELMERKYLATFWEKMNINPLLGQ